MAVRLREADRIATVAELQQHIAELEIQKEEGKIQGQLNNSDSSQYIRELKDQIAELKHEIRCLKSQKGLSDPPTFDGIHIVNHMIGDDVSFHSSDEDFATGSLGQGDVHYGLTKKHAKMMLVPSDLDSSDSDAEELDILADSDAVIQKPVATRTESYSTAV
ncbi:PREDICTED: ecotropic viral integration site 5 protein homolog isoform X1 [Nanorana parkeri]|uniref:ecotropic viral integration site 5 protein homolog isoform X1 n=1 Tax=Nanorana parkeri TaxID=125878 RepID=UPI0008542694|nr:PREDICTED: ecotropic viral integration site 5 protein homolog isoform X1 [Nanorana parkeri]